MFDRKTFLIGTLTLSAAILTASHFQFGSTAQANETVMDNDYQLVTALTAKGDDGVYILHKRRNLVALFTWDPAKKSIAPRDVKALDVIMAGG